MHSPFLFRPAAIAAVLLLSACGEPETIVAGGPPADPTAAELNAAAPVELPPAMTDSRSYRCADNSTVFIDFFAGDKLAIARAGSRDATAVRLTAEEAGQPLTAEGGWSLEGKGATVQVAQPGKPEQSCKA